MELLFGDIVIVEKSLVGVVVKTWMNQKMENNYEVYVRAYNSIQEYPENEIERYKVRHKILTKSELKYQNLTD